MYTVAPYRRGEQKAEFFLAPLFPFRRSSSNSCYINHSKGCWQILCGCSRLTFTNRQLRWMVLFCLPSDRGTGSWAGRGGSREKSFPSASASSFSFNKATSNREFPAYRRRTSQCNVCVRSAYLADAA